MKDLEIMDVTTAFLNRDDVHTNKDKYAQYYGKVENQISGRDDDTHNMVSICMQMRCKKYIKNNHTNAYHERKGITF